ncbi:MAG: outer membrane lipoprotein LolB [Gammaproteobacteria bacterium]|nr:outer membrane lipoprotein LolB [Gammaproteobacteria bacterium]
MKAVLTVLAAVSLAGCAVAPRVEYPALSWPERAAQLSALQDWELRGRVAVQTDDNRGGQAALHWRHETERHTLTLRGPLGGGLLRLQQDRHGARLQDAERRDYRAASAEEALFAATGWRMPLSGLEYWIRGLPAPGEVARQEWDELGRLAHLRQFGWDVHFLDYSPSGRYELPSRLDVTLPALEHQARAEARIVIDEWVLN